MEEIWNDAPRHFWRATRKRFGLAASPDVGVLSGIIQESVELLTTNNPHLQDLKKKPITVISFPGILALYNEDIVDAAEYIGLPLLQGMTSYQPREITAAYAGHGMGLCETYDDVEKCRAEGLQLPTRYNLLIEYTKVALLLDSRFVQQAISIGRRYENSGASYTLGNESRGRMGYTGKVKTFVLEFLQHQLKYVHDPLEEIIVTMTGAQEDINDVDFQTAINEAIEELGVSAKILSSQSNYVAARGAGELSWRAQHISRND
jgi:hypothetical protein